MKIFEFNPQKGYIDQVSGAVGVNTDGEIVRSEKGLAWRGNRSTKITFPYSFSGTKLAYEVWFTPKKSPLDSLSHLICGNSYTNRLGYSTSSGKLTFYPTSGGATYVVGTGIVKWNEPNYVFVFIENSGAGYSCTITLNDIPKETLTNANVNIQTVSTSYIIGGWDVANYGIIGDIHKLAIYDDTLSSKEIAKEYAEFLNSHPIERTIR